jgi:hypothetical protein
MPRGARATFTAFATWGLALAACRGGPPADVMTDAGVSPQAIAEPAPLANALVTASAAPFAPEAGPPPVPLRADEAVSADPAAKDALGWEMEASLHPVDPPPAFRGPETSIAAIDALKKRTEPRVVVDFTASRGRIVIASGAFALPADTELRARADRYGFFLLLPSTDQYRVVAPGALRALFDDRRIDVEPLASADVAVRGEGSRRLGYRTRRVDVINRAGAATFEVARVADTGEGGVLICRALLDLMNAPQSTPVCAADDVPLHVEWRWPNKSSFAFDATSLEHRADLGATSLQAPPSSASFALPALPYVGAEAIASPSELASFRTAPAETPAPAAGDGGVKSPEAGLALGNVGDQLRFAWLDGAPVAWVAPAGKLALPSLLRGRYGFAWRSFLADAVDAPITIAAPSVLAAGGYDAGAP